MSKGEKGTKLIDSVQEMDAHGMLPRENMGLPSLNLDHMQGTRVMDCWKTVKTMGDIIMAEYVDENENGEVMRGSIWVKMEVVQKLWRVARVLKLGPKCSGNIKIGDLIRFPGDRGIPMITSDGNKYIYLNEERVFDVVEPGEGNMLLENKKNE